MFFLDTNIFLELLLEQKNAEKCKKFFDVTMSEEIDLICSHFSIHAIEAVLSSKGKNIALKKFLENLQATTNLQIYNTNLEEEKQVIQVINDTNLDFDDALQYFVAKKNHCKAIISFDSDFDKTDLFRQTPNEILEQKERKKSI